MYLKAPLVINLEFTFGGGNGDRFILSWSKAIAIRTTPIKPM
jgi:hypothetical protein